MIRKESTWSEEGDENDGFTFTSVGVEEGAA